MKISVTKNSKDGLASVTFSSVAPDATPDEAKQIGDALLAKAGDVIDARFEGIKAARKARREARRFGGRARVEDAARRHGAPLSVGAAPLALDANEGDDMDDADKAVAAE